MKLLLVIYGCLVLLIWGCLDLEFFPRLILSLVFAFLVLGDLAMAGVGKSRRK